MKKLPTNVFGAQQCEPFSNKWVCLPIRPKWTNFNFFQQFTVQNQNSKRVYVMEKIDIQCIQGTMGQAVLVKCMPADWPKKANFYNLKNKIQNNLGLLISKSFCRPKLALSVSAPQPTANQQKLLKNLFNYFFQF